MTKYCPVCELEYKNSVQKCSDDGAKLVNRLVPKKLKQTAIDIYAAAGEIEAERIVSFLQAKEIEASKRQNNISQLPFPGDNLHIITVPTEVREQASKLIENARRDGVITQEGDFL